MTKLPPRRPRSRRPCVRCGQVAILFPRSICVDCFRRQAVDQYLDDLEAFAEYKANL